jgi:hypothetical protein
MHTHTYAFTHTHMHSHTHTHSLTHAHSGVPEVQSRGTVTTLRHYRNTTVTPQVDDVLLAVKGREHEAQGLRDGGKAQPEFNQYNN